MATTAIHSRFWRGGVCNALIFRRADLPADRTTWHKLFANAMGSPDPYGRQLNGMGGGVSSLSKICIVSPSSREDADVDFEFVQVVIEDGALDLASNCGNMTAAIGPFALDEKLFSPSPTQLSKQPGHTTVRIFNTNTKKVIASTFPISGQPPRFQPHGAYKMDGVPGTGSKISLSFLSPGGTQTGAVFPTGQGITSMATTGKDGRRVKASLVDVANPVVYVDGASLGIAPGTTPVELDQMTETMASPESIRREAASLMGMNPDVASVPKLVILFPPQDANVNITCMALSMGQAHKAIPLTLALNLAVACRFEGNLASGLVKYVGGDGKVIIQHPSGTITVGTDIRGDDVESATIYSTARLLMSGESNTEGPVPPPPFPTPNPNTVDISLPQYRQQEMTVPYKLRDIFCWNLHETLISTDQFAQTLVQDLDLPHRQNAIAEISKQIRTQLEEYAGVALHPLFHAEQPAPSLPQPTASGLTPRPSFALKSRDESPASAIRGTSRPDTPAQTGAPTSSQTQAPDVTAEATPILPDSDDYNPDDTYRCIINLNLNLASMLYTDKFEWSLLHPPGTAEAFAKVTCADLGLTGEWIPAMTHAIYEAVLRLKKEACEAGGLVAGCKCLQ